MRQYFKIGLFLGFLQTSFIIAILPENISDNFRNLSWKFVITIFGNVSRFYDATFISIWVDSRPREGTTTWGYGRQVTIFAHVHGIWCDDSHQSNMQGDVWRSRKFTIAEERNCLHSSDISALVASTSNSSSLVIVEDGKIESSPLRLFPNAAWIRALLARASAR